MVKMKIKQMYGYIIMALIISIILITPCQAKVYLDVFGSTFKKITIGAPYFKSETPTRLVADMSELLNKDLDLSGFFIVAPISLFDKELLEEGVEKGSIRFGNWRSIGIEVLCKGRLIERANELILEAYLYDTIDGSLLLAKRYTSKTEDWRRVVHRLADDIVYTITGAKGIMGLKVLFVSGSRNRKNLYIADMDGQNIVRLTNYRSITLSPSISPDGRYLAYTSYKEGRPNLYIVDRQTNKEVYVDRADGMKLGTTWARNSIFGYSHTSGRNSTIYAYDVEKREKRVILKGEGIYTSPSFSPDGSKMVYVSDQYGSPQIFIKDLLSGETKRLTYWGNYNTSPCISPKGDLIAFVAKFEGAIEICVMNIDGSNPQVLTNGGINDSPQFSPCGRYIIYSSNKGSDRFSINIMLYNGENKRMLKFTNSDEAQPKFVP